MSDDLIVVHRKMPKRLLVIGAMVGIIAGMCIGPAVIHLFVLLFGVKALTYYNILFSVAIFGVPVTWLGLRHSPAQARLAEQPTPAKLAEAQAELAEALAELEGVSLDPLDRELAALKEKLHADQ